MPRSRVTIRDVAAAAGVSHQTVSRVINDSERVLPETRLKVEAAIERLGYRPNEIARFMAKGRTYTLACISPNLTDYTFAAIIEGAEVEARSRGFFLLSASAADEATFAELVEQLIDSRRTEGLLVINPYADERHQFIPRSVRQVFIGAQPRGEKVDSVSLDDVGAGRTATDYLLALGHRRIALITGPTAEDCTLDRQTGYQLALQAAGLVFDPGLVVHGEWSANSGYQAVRLLLDRGVEFSAIFAHNDLIAAGAIRALREAGKRVPADVSVVGFDDIPLASYLDPPLTTVAQDPFRIGREAAALLVRAVENPSENPQHLRIPAELVVRGTTAPFSERR